MEKTATEEASPVVVGVVAVASPPAGSRPLA